MKTKCQMCKFYTDLSDEAIQHCYDSDQEYKDVQIGKEWHHIVLSCTGFQPTTQPTPIDQNAQPAILQR